MRDSTHFVLVSSTKEVFLQTDLTTQASLLPLWGFLSVAEAIQEGNKSEQLTKMLKASSHLLDNIPEEELEQIVSHLSHLGFRTTPPFGLPEHRDYWIYHGDLPNQLSATTPLSRMISINDAIEKFNSHAIRLHPETLQILRNIQGSSSIEEAIKLSLEQASRPLPEQQTKLEFVPYTQVIPIPSNTIKPFSNTNLIIFESIGECLIVDPGASPEGADQFRAILKGLPSPPQVFITHHHHDHCDGLPIVEEVQPESVIIGHQLTIDRITDTKLKKKVCNGGETLNVGSLTLQVIHTPGHTDGHLVLFQPESGTLVAGDHVVGFGSAVLDFECGDMLDYFNSTRLLISLDPKVALPAHGPPNFAPVNLLEQYILHRQEREVAILRATENGKETLDEIVKVVYKDVPEEMWEWAKSNIALHLKKLEKENRIKSKGSSLYLTRSDSNK